MFLPLLVAAAIAEPNFQVVEPDRTEIVTPVRNATFNKGGTAQVRKQGGNPHFVEGNLVFDGSSDGNRQVDPQIAVGGGYVLHGTNGGIVIYDKKGNYVDGVPQTEFAGGIDPKLFFDSNNRVFGFDFWKYYDKPKLKPVNISISETSDPRGAWNTYSISSQEEVDGGGIGFSRKWIGYSYPGGHDQTFVMKMDDARKGKPATIYHFAGNLGQPVFTQDPMDDLIFVSLTPTDIVLTTVGTGQSGEPVVKSVMRAPHHFAYFGWPPESPMKGTAAKTASGDHNPKNLVVQGQRLWFSQTVDVDGRAGVAWHEMTLDGTFVQDGLIADPVNSYIETTIAVNRRNDMLVGFQETGPDMFISARCAWRKAGDPRGKLRAIIPFAEGLAATAGGAWGDYSGSTMDGDNHTDLWTIQSFANADGRGSTAIMRVRP